MNNLTPNTNVLVIVCENAVELQKAHLQLPRSINITRFFILQDNIDTSFLDNKDISIYIPKYIDDKTNIHHVIIRASVIYSYGWNIVLCYANNLPSMQEIILLFNKLSTNNDFIIDNKTISFTKEYIVINGFEDLFINKKEDVVIDNHIPLMVAAMQGLPVPENIAIEAIEQVCQLKSISVEDISVTQTYGGMLNRIIEKAGSQDDGTPYTIILGEYANESIVERYINEIPEGGTVIVITSKGDMITRTISPYRIFKVADGKSYEILLFSRKPN